MIQIKETPYNFEVQFGYKPKLVSEIKNIPGRRFNMTRKLWTVPLEERETLISWAKKYTNNPFGDNAPRIVDFTLPEMPELKQDIPLKLKMYPYQRTGVAYGLDKKRVIVGDEPGLGKTGQAIGMAVAKGAKCALIICPATLKENWRREVLKWSDRKPMILQDKVKKSWPSYNRVGMIDTIIVNYESLKKYFVEKIERPIDPKTGVTKPLRLNHIHFKPEINLFDFIIIDESHRCKDGSTQQAKFVMGIAKDKEHVYCLTGTPMVNNPKDLIPQLHILNQLVPVFGGYKNFVSRYCDGPNGSSNLKELNYLLRTHCYYRREKKDVLKDLPEKVRQIVKCELTNQEEYNKAKIFFEQFLRENLQRTEGEIDLALRAEILVKMMMLKRLSALGKLESVYEFVDEVIEAGERIVLFAWHNDVITSIMKRYPGAVKITGEDGQQEKQAAIDAFQGCKRCGVNLQEHKGLDHDHEESDTKIIVCNIKSGGVGVTLTTSSRVAFVELPWHPADCDQCEDRCHRIGQVDSVQCIYFLGDKSIDEEIYQIIQEKREISDQITGNETEIQTSIVDQLVSLINKN